MAMRRQTALALTLAITTFLVACAASTERPRLIESPTALIAGQVLVTPIDLAGVSAGDDPFDAPPLRFSDGRTIDTSIETFVPTRSNSSNEWLANNSGWTRSSPRVEQARTFLVASIPSASLGLDLWMDGARVPSYWVVPELTEQPVTRSDSRSPPDAQLADLLRLLEPEFGEPRLRWRAQLALERLGLEAPRHAFADPALEAWAVRWSALAEAAERRLRQADAAIADRWIETLTRCVSTSDAVLPMWPTNTADITDTIRALHSPEASDASVVRTAEAFLDRQPQWLAWVADDAGGIAGGTISVVNLSTREALLSSRAPGGRWTAHGMVAPNELVKLPAAADTSGPTTGVWQVRLGGRTRSLPVATGAIPLEPPGVSIGPFWHDWTLPGIRVGTGRSPAPGSSGWVGGLVHRDPRLELPLSNASGWAIYVEVRTQPCELPEPGRALTATDSIRVAFGPNEEARAELTIRCTGVTSTEVLGPMAGEGEPAILTTARDRWAFTLPIDQSWMEPDGTILVGLQSVPAEGIRASWPRPLLPGQPDLGRVRIDPSAWGLSARRTTATAQSPAATRR